MTYPALQALHIQRIEYLELHIQVVTGLGQEVKCPLLQGRHRVTVEFQPHVLPSEKLEIVPVEVNIRNIVAGGMAKNLGLEEGIVLKEPVLEYHYKRDDLHDPLFNEYHIRALGLATDDEMKQINAMAFKVNDVTKKFFSDKGLDLVDFKLEFGRSKGEILLGDEFSPDTCRLWEKGTGRKMDKDRFRRDLGDVEQAYQDVLKIVTG